MYIDNRGYIRVKGVLAHRLIMEEYLGRKLKSKEFVHHINGDKTDNHLINLELMTQSKHVAHHNIGNKFASKYMDDRRCFKCGSDKTYSSKFGYPKWYIVKNKPLCSICYNRDYNSRRIR